MPPESVIEIRNLSKAYRDFWGRKKVQAVNGLSLDVRKGEVFGLLGPNGSGKTTTLKLLLGLLFPTEGEIRILGRPAADVEKNRFIGYLPEESYLYRFLNAEETLDFYGRLFGLSKAERRRRTDELISLVKLDHARKRQLKEYSKGMTRRIGLAQGADQRPGHHLPRRADERPRPQRPQGREGPDRPPQGAGQDGRDVQPPARGDRGRLRPGRDPLQRRAEAAGDGGRAARLAGARRSSAPPPWPRRRCGTWRPRWPGTGRRSKASAIPSGRSKTCSCTPSAPASPDPARGSSTARFRPSGPASSGPVPAGDAAARPQPVAARK